MGLNRGVGPAIRLSREGEEGAQGQRMRGKEQDAEARPEKNEDGRINIGDGRFEKIDLRRQI